MHAAYAVGVEVLPDGRFKAEFDGDMGFGDTFSDALAALALRIARLQHERQPIPTREVSR